MTNQKRTEKSTVPTPPEDRRVEVNRVGTPLRLLVLEKALGIPVRELRELPHLQIRALLQQSEGLLERAAQSILEEGESGRPFEPPKEVNLPATEAELKNRIDEAYKFLYGRYAYHAYLGGPYDFMKEYSGFPLGITTNSPFYPPKRMLGEAITHLLGTFPAATIDLVSMGSNWCFQDVSFEDGSDFDYNEPFCWADRLYATPEPGSQTIFALSIQKYEGSLAVDLYLRGELILADLKNQTLPQNFSWSAPAWWGESWACSRYTIRHACITAWKCWDAKDDGRAWWLKHLCDDFGFELDIYDPMYNYSSNWPQDRWCFDPDAYRDCGITETLPRDLGGTHKAHYYPFESKVCWARGSCGIPGTYIWLSQRDRLVPILQATHILTKYGNPNYSYLSPKDDGSYTTPTEVARDMEQNCWAGGGSPGSGYGINVWGQDTAYASAVRTNAFMVLETLLGYKYNDTVSKAYADRMADVLIQVQWGSPPFNPLQGETAEYGVLTRPYQGGQLLGWKPGSGYQYSLPPKSWLSAVIDWLSMPNEELDFVPSNTESTTTYLQALRVYLRHKYSVSYPSNKWLPV